MKTGDITLLAAAALMLAACGVSEDQPGDRSGDFCLTYELQSGCFPTILVSGEDFGEVRLGETAVVTLTVQNLAEGPLHIREIDFLESDADEYREFRPRGWEHADRPILIDGFDERELEVVYQPLNRVEDELEIIFRSNDPANDPDGIRYRPRITD